MAITSEVFQENDRPDTAVTPPKPRHALGLPAGSVRALLAIGVLGLMWAIVLRYKFGDTPLSEAKLPLPFVYLQILMVLILAHFFGTHGHTIGTHISESSPLGLPTGTVRFLLLAGYLGLAYYLYQAKPDLEFGAQGPFILMVGLLITGFVVGHVLSAAMRFIGRGRLPDWFLDIEAWVALIATIGLGILLIVHILINPQLSDEIRLEMPTWEAGLAAVIGFYFGARS
jgi:hypothetical protein